MPQKGGAGGDPWRLLDPATPRPVLERSAVVNLEGLEKASAAIPLYFHALLLGVLPPFPGFLDAVLSHYQIHTLHLDPYSLILLSAFTLLCKAFVDVTPSVELLRHFFSLELAFKLHCSGCAFLKIDGVSAPGTPGVELLPEAEDFRRQWVLVEAVGVGALFQPPSSPSTPKRGWECEELRDPRLVPVLTRLEQCLEQERLETWERVLSLADESLASREGKLEEEIDRRVGEARRYLLLDYRVKLKLQESCFLRCRDCLQNEVNTLRRGLDQEMESRQAALDAHAITKGKLSNMCKHVKGVPSLVEEASEEAARACSLQLECSNMFQSLEWRASRALGDICGEGVSGPLIPDDSGYFGFFCRVMEHLEASAGKALALARRAETF
ncbi:hypothetical protein D1007_27453 [Hordeum vulgare]|nr:hypothetical protein D1007_27453 [Hordeum vulgare]